MKISGYILKRILQTIPLLIFVSIISFFIIRLSPVDPLGELRLNPSISQETLEKLSPGHRGRPCLCADPFDRGRKSGSGRNSFR